MSSLYEQIKADLGYLKMDAAADTFATLAEQARSDGWSHIEFLARLVGEQATADRDRRLAARLRYARFPYRRTIDEFDFEFQPTVDRKLIEDLATLRFIDENCWSSRYAAWGWLMVVRSAANSAGVRSPWAVWGRLML